jgi:hypothetical protein
MSINNENLRNVAQAALEIMEGKIKHPNQQKLDVHEPEKDELTAKDFEMLRNKKKMKEEAEQVEEAMQKADVPAYLRKQQGEKPLTMADMKAPRKDSISAKENLAKARNEEVEQIEEADVEKTATGMKVYGSSYGNSQRARREQIKKDVDTIKGPKMKDLSDIEAEKKKKKKFSEMVESYTTGGIKSLFASLVKEEPTNDEFKKELEDQKAKAEGKKKQPDLAKGSVQAVQNEQIEESFTVGEKMPNKQGGHNQDVHYNGKKIGHIESYSHRTGMRYGMEHQVSGEGSAGSRSHEEALSDLKAAHKEHMKEEVEQLDELSPGTLKSYVNKAKPEVKAAKAERADARDAGDGKTANDAFQMAKKRTAGIKQAKAKLNKEDTQEVEVVMNELNGYTEVTIDERSMTEPEMKKKEEIVKSMKKGMQGFKDRYGSDAKSVMYATATKQAMKD